MILFLFHSEVTTTLGGLLPGVFLVLGVDGELPPLLNGADGSGGRLPGDPMTARHQTLPSTLVSYQDDYSLS